MADVLSDRAKALKAAMDMEEHGPSRPSPAPSAPAPLPDYSRPRGLEASGFSGAESRAIHKSAGNDNPPRSRSDVEKESAVKSKAGTGRVISNEDL